MNAQSCGHVPSEPIITGKEQEQSVLPSSRATTQKKDDDVQQQCNKERYMFTDVTTLPPKQNTQNNCDSYLSGTAVHSVAAKCKNGAFVNM